MKTLRNVFAALVACIFVIPLASLQPNKAQEINRLNWLEVSKGQFATQIMFDFAQPVYFKKKVNQQRNQVKLTFPGMQLRHFESAKVLLKLAKLKELGLASKIALTQKEKTISHVVLTIDFAAESKTATKSNEFLIKWSKIDDPNRLILDIFTQDNLDQLNKKTKILMQA